MASGRFEVRLTGETDGTRDAGETRAALMQLFKLSEEEVARLLESAPVTVKHGLDYDTAAKYKAAIEQTGARCRLREEGARDEAPGTVAAESHGVAPAAAVAHAPADAPGAGDRDPPVAPGGNPPNVSRRVDAGRGAGWWGEGWRLFRAAPVPWLLMGVVGFVLFVLTAMVPLVNIVAYFLLPPLLMGGMMFAAQVQHDGGDARVGHLFEGFSRRTGPLLGVGGLCLLASVVVGVVCMMLMLALGAGGVMMSGVSMDGPDAMNSAATMFASGGVMLVVVVAVALSLLVYAAVWFAPPLVMLSGLGAVDAMRESLFGCLRNWLALLVFGLLMVALGVLSLFTLGLAWLVLGPVLVLGVFAGYRDIYIGKD